MPFAHLGNTFWTNLLIKQFNLSKNIANELKEPEFRVRIWPWKVLVPTLSKTIDPNPTQKKYADPIRELHLYIRIRDPAKGTQVGKICPNTL